MLFFINCYIAKYFLNSNTSGVDIYSSIICFFDAVFILMSFYLFYVNTLPAIYL